MITQLNRLLAVPAVLFLAASSACAENGSGDFSVGRSTKADVRARFGAPGFETERYWSYYAHEMGPPRIRNGFAKCGASSAWSSSNSMNAACS